MGWLVLTENQPLCRFNTCSLLTRAIVFIRVFFFFVDFYKYYFFSSETQIYCAVMIPFCGLFSVLQVTQPYINIKGIAYHDVSSSKFNAIFFYHDDFKNLQTQINRRPSLIHTRPRFAYLCLSLLTLFLFQLYQWRRNILY